MRRDHRKNQLLKGNRWLAVFALVLMVWGQFAYACHAMEMPPQAYCCCADGMAGCNTALAQNDGCDHAPAGRSSTACCSLQYSSLADEAITTSPVPEPPLAWLHLIALAHWPSIETFLAPAYARSNTVDIHWLLAQADAGRTVYLSTLRLRI